MDHAIRDTEAIYNDYVEYYNNAGNSKACHIPIFAELSQIEETLKAKVDELDSMLKEAEAIVIKNLESITKEYLNDQLELKNWGAKLKLRDEIMNSLKFSIDKAVIYTDLLTDFKNLTKNVENFFKGLDLDLLELGTSLSMLAIESILSKFIQAKYHHMALWGLNGKIIFENYPQELEYYNDLPEEDKARLNPKVSRFGAPLKEEAPQEIIEEIVQKCVKDKSNKRFIHQSGRYKGKANQKQIYEYIRSNFPEMVNGVGSNPKNGITERQFIRRIKKALSDVMT